VDPPDLCCWPPERDEGCETPPRCAFRPLRGSPTFVQPLSADISKKSTRRRSNGCDEDRSETRNEPRVQGRSEDIDAKGDSFAPLFQSYVLIRERSGYYTQFSLHWDQLSPSSTSKEGRADQLHIPGLEPRRHVLHPFHITSRTKEVGANHLIL